MNSDGSLYARRVWYAGDIDALPQFTPEGLVRRVGDNWLSIQKKKTEALATGDRYHRCDWNAETVFVDAATTWNFQGVDMGLTGTDGPPSSSPGASAWRSSTSTRTPLPKVAKSINVQFAHAEGLVIEPTLDNFKLGWMLAASGPWSTATSPVTSSAGGSTGRIPPAPPTVRPFIDSIHAARTAHLWVFAWAGLTWDEANARWVVENLVLAPLKLHDFTKITTGYTAATRDRWTSRRFNCWDCDDPGGHDHQARHDRRPPDDRRLVHLEGRHQHRDLHAAGPARGLGGPADARRSTRSRSGSIRSRRTTGP